LQEGGGFFLHILMEWSFSLIWAPACLCPFSLKGGGLFARGCTNLGKNWLKFNGVLPENMKNVYTMLAGENLAHVNIFHFTGCCALQKKSNQVFYRKVESNSFFLKGVFFLQSHDCGLFLGGCFP